MKTILVIEDQPVMRHKTVTILKMEGYEVLEAANGPKASAWRTRNCPISSCATS